MAYRVLVDENIDPRTADSLREKGHESVHVDEALGKGTEDPPIADHARQQEYLLLTNDADFLRPDLREDLTVLYCPENTLRAEAIATLVDELASLVPDPADLPTVVWITEELTS